MGANNKIRLWLTYEEKEDIEELPGRIQSLEIPVQINDRNKGSDSIGQTKSHCKTQLSQSDTTLITATKAHLSEQILNLPISASLVQDSKSWAETSTWPSPGYVPLSYLLGSGRTGLWSLSASVVGSRAIEIHTAGLSPKENGVWMKASQNAQKLTQ